MGGTIAVYRRGSRYRLDLLTLGFPGVDPTAGAVAGMLLVPGGATLLYDGATGVVSAYANGNRAYYAGSPAPTAPHQATRPPLAPAGDNDPLAALAGIARQLHDVTAARIELTGHSVVNGHPTDDLDVSVKRQRPGKPREDYHAQVSLADDLAGFPVRISVSSTPPTPQDVGGSARLDLTAIAPDPPDDATFAIPAGYIRVDSLGAVLQSRR